MPRWRNDFNPRPARGATAAHSRCWPQAQDFDPRPPQGGDPQSGAVRPVRTDFNPRPPRGGRHALCRAMFFRPSIFQSTPPARGATLPEPQVIHVVIISIHAPREGGDASPRRSCSPCGHFNPRPPRGGRLCFSGCSISNVEFQSTPPREGGDSVRYKLTPET